ncbi:MAG: glycosyl hydrolase 53 family protein [Muribaculaceae bacterium]|nr:glycosyl hydrolase 53 family protein [Muribaculaceae bacterium]
MKYVGGDISMFPTYQEAGSAYKDQDGNKIDLLPYLHEIGMNAMRVRLFVDPEEYTIENGVKHEDTNVCQDLPYITPLCQQIIENGMDLMLDFHYSDTWADPAKQFIPEAWKNLSQEELIEMIYNYTKESLETLKAEGIVPKFIQPGNEISYGMLWASNSDKAYSNNNSSAAWKRFGDLLTSAINACREVCPEAQIVIHTERVAQVGVLTNFYSQMESLNIDYDIIGLSYYPYFHGNMEVLNKALTEVETQFPDKPIMIVETGFPYAWEVPGSTITPEYSYTLEGQNEYAQALVETLLEHPNVNGLFWWWLEYNAKGTELDGWYNAPLFDSRTGKATPALKTIASFATEAGIEGVASDLQTEKDIWHNLQGLRINSPSRPGIYIHNGQKILVK